MIPNPLDLITDAAKGWAWDKVVAGIGQWVLDAITAVLSGIVNFLQTSARADVTDAWFSGAGSPHATVRNLAGVLMVTAVRMVRPSIVRSVVTASRGDAIVFILTAGVTDGPNRKRRAGLQFKLLPSL